MNVAGPRRTSSEQRRFQVRSQLPVGPQKFETCPDWGPGMDTRRRAPRISVKAFLVQLFDHSASWPTKVRNVSRPGGANQNRPFDSLLCGCPQFTARTRRRCSGQLPGGRLHPPQRKCVARHLTRRVFGAILRRIWALPLPAGNGRWLLAPRTLAKEKRERWWECPRRNAPKLPVGFGPEVSWVLLQASGDALQQKTWSQSRRLWYTDRSSEPKWKSRLR
jgi:hypothetical protein